MTKLNPSLLLRSSRLCLSGYGAQRIRILPLKQAVARYASSSKNQSDTKWQQYLYSQDVAKAKKIAEDMQVLPDFITPEEEQWLVSDIQPAFKRIKYEYSHWDNVGDRTLWIKVLAIVFCNYSWY